MIIKGYSYVAPSILFSSNVLTAGPDLNAGQCGNSTANGPTQTTTVTCAQQSTTSTCDTATSAIPVAAINHSVFLLNTSFSTSVNSWLKVSFSHSFVLLSLSLSLQTENFNEKLNHLKNRIPHSIKYTKSTLTQILAREASVCASNCLVKYFI